MGGVLNTGTAMFTWNVFLKGSLCLGGSHLHALTWMPGTTNPNHSLWFYPNILNVYSNQNSDFHPQTATEHSMPLYWQSGYFENS